MKKLLTVKNEKDNPDVIAVKFDEYMADISINGKNCFKTSYSPDIDLDRAAKELTRVLSRESKREQTSLYYSIFPSFGREFKMLVSDILKARV